MKKHIKGMKIISKIDYVKPLYVIQGEIYV